MFRPDAIAVFIEWKEEAGVTYVTSSFPQALSIKTSIGSARVQLTLSYNTVYTVNVTAILCGQNSVSTAVNLSYGEFHNRI